MRRGGASAKQANREARRSQAGHNSSKITKAVTSGEANPENLDTVARLAGRLTEPEHLRALQDLDGEVAANVIKMGPELFNSWYRRKLHRTCPLDGNTTFEMCEIHHVCFYATSNGPTDIYNLLPISKRWHHLIHEGGWHLKINPDRSLILTSPDGKYNRAIPPPKPPGQNSSA